ncbi:Isoprenoid synthase domain containing protein [Naviculisporaceae sp. PSN 640]
MDFVYSYPVDPTTYETHGLAEGIPVRVHRETYREAEGSLQAQRDWSEHVRPMPRYHGGLGDKFNLMSVSIPECLPERLEIISYANEFAFLYDDAMEELLDDQEGRPENQRNDSLIAMFREGVMNAETEGQCRPEKLLQAKILKEMMAIDKPRAVTAMKAWASFVQLASQTRAQTIFSSLNEYIPARVVDVGELIWFGTVTFAMALTIAPEEYQLCMKLARPCYVALALTNDLYSWTKERIAAEAAGQDCIFNAIWVIMRELSEIRQCNITGDDALEAEAIDICKAEIKKHVSEYRTIVEQAKNNTSFSRDLKAYLEAILYTISGNLVWSIYCPRYNSH